MISSLCSFCRGDASGFAFHVALSFQTTLSGASQYLFSALDSRAYLRSATVILPTSWPDSCASTPVTSASGDTPDITVLPQGPARGHIWTQQSLGCEQPGDQIYLAYEKLRSRDNILGTHIFLLPQKLGN